MLLLPEVFVRDGGDEEDRVSGPFLDAGQVEEGEAAGAAPHLHRKVCFRTGRVRFTGSGRFKAT